MLIFNSRIHTLDYATKLQIRTKNENINGNRNKNNVYTCNNQIRDARPKCYASLTHNLRRLHQAWWLRHGGCKGTLLNDPLGENS